MRSLQNAERQPASNSTPLMPRDSEPDWEKLLDSDMDQEELQVIREELADAVRGQGPLPWTLLIAGFVVAWIVLGPA